MTQSTIFESHKYGSWYYKDGVAFLGYMTPICEPVVFYVTEEGIKSIEVPKKIFKYTDFKKYLTRLIRGVVMCVVLDGPEYYTKELNAMLWQRTEALKNLYQKHGNHFLMRLEYHSEHASKVLEKRKAISTQQ